MYIQLQLMRDTELEVDKTSMHFQKRLVETVLFDCLVFMYPGGGALRRLMHCKCALAVILHCSGL